MNEKYAMYNLVWYDGTDASVMKFITYDRDNETTLDKCYDELTHIQECYSDNELVKVDKLYTLSLENIVGLYNLQYKDENNTSIRVNPEMQAAIDWIQEH